MWIVILLIIVIFILYFYFAYKNSPDVQIKKCEETSNWFYQRVSKELHDQFKKTDTFQDYFGEKKIEIVSAQIKKLENTKNKYIRLKEKYLYLPFDKKTDIYNDWLHFVHSMDRWIGAHDPLWDDFDKKEKIRKESEIAMEEIEKRFNTKLKGK